MSADITPIEVKEWLDEAVKAGNLSDEERKALDNTFSKKELVEFVKGSVLRQADYSRKMNEFNDQKKALETEQANITKLQTDLVTWKNTNEGKFQQALRDLEAARNRESALANAIEVHYGVAPSTILGEGYSPPVSANGNGSGAFTKEQFDAEIAKVRQEHQEQIRGVVYELAYWPGQAMELAQEAQRLGITDFKANAVLAKMIEAKNFDGSAVFDEMYGASSKRQALQEAEIQKRIDAAREEGITRGRQDAMLPQSHAAPGDSYISALIKGTPDDATPITISKEHVPLAAESLAQATGVPRRAF